MFSFIRWVSAVSFLVVMFGVIFFGHEFRKIATSNLIDTVNNSNNNMARNFQNTTWKAYREQVRTGLDWYQKFRASGVQATEWHKYNGYQEMITAFGVMDHFSRHVFKHFEDSPIAEINLYTQDGVRILSVNQSHTIWVQDPKTIGSATPVKPSEDVDFASVLGGSVASGVMDEQSFIKPDGTTAQGTFIRGLFPVFRDESQPQSASILVDCEKDGKNDVGCKNAGNDKRPIDVVLELRYDVSAQWNQLQFFYRISVYGVMGVFSLMILLMLFTSGKAESIIAKQHEANLELAAQAASAQAENRDKSQFLANVSHELRTPLNAIIGFSEFIKSERSGKIGNEKYAEYIRDIHGSGVHLLSLINDILDYSKAEADKLELDISEVDATKLVKNSMRLVSPRAEGAQVHLVEEIPREHFIIETDAKKFKQVLLNLLSNAVKFTPSGGSVTVTMWSNVVDGGLSVEVRDTGIGIAPKDISRAMAPFGQVDNTLSRKYEGTGLGLPLTRKFVEIMGGTFNIASEVGKGTTITIALPKKPKGKADLAEPAPVAAKHAKQTEEALPIAGNVNEPPTRNANPPQALSL